MKFQAVLIVLASVICVSLTIEIIDGMDEAAAMNCFYRVICGARDTDGFRELIVNSGDKLKAMAWKWFEEISKIPNAGDTPEFWSTYPDKKCANSDQVKEEMFYEWMARIGELYTETCSDPTSADCKHLQSIVSKVKDFFTKNMLNGVCSLNMGKEMAEKAQKMAGSGLGQMQSKIPMPSFG